MRMRAAVALLMALALAACGSTPARRQAARGAATGSLAGCAELAPHLKAAADAHGLDFGLLAGVAWVETRFRNLVNRRSGARGYLQLMPATARRLGCGDLDEMSENLACGARLLRNLLDRFEGSVLLALSGYHAGLRMPNAARAERRLPKNRSYVEKVLAARTRILREGCR